MTSLEPFRNFTEFNFPHGETNCRTLTYNNKINNSWFWSSMLCSMLCSECETGGVTHTSNGYTWLWICVCVHRCNITWFRNSNRSGIPPALFSASPLFLARPATRCSDACTSPSGKLSWCICSGNPRCRTPPKSRKWFWARLLAAVWN